MTRLIFLAISTLLLAAGCTSETPAQHQAEIVPTQTPAEGETDAIERNVVQIEMELLTTVLENAVRGVGDGVVSHIADELHQLDEAKHATEAAIEDGSYVLPRNSDQLSAFLAMDGAFHDQLEAMINASRADDVPAMALAIGDTLNSCYSCHALFRDP
ncbi:hypothetical protein ACOPJQ_11925 [Luteimonas dalianensis]|jgi:hypothetical protein|uniref:hypothetical protein n=1 Tax=Luteimonas dalianensis TaxID=1148196 RepID=UPI003BF0C71C